MPSVFPTISDRSAVSNRKVFGHGLDAYRGQFALFEGRARR